MKTTAEQRNKWRHRSYGFVLGGPLPQKCIEDLLDDFAELEKELLRERHIAHEELMARKYLEHELGEARELLRQAPLERLGREARLTPAGKEWASFRDAFIARTEPNRR